MRDTKDRVRVDVSNYDPSDSCYESVSYHFNYEDTDKILDFLKVNIEAGMYVLIHPWWREEERKCL